MENEEPKQEEPIIEDKPLGVLLPKCPKCHADPLIPIAREIRIPFSRHKPPAPFIIVFCGQCREMIPASDIIFLGFPESNIVAPN